MANCQSSGLVFTETYEFLIAALFTALLPLCVCYCAVWKIVIIPFHPPRAGLWEASVQKKWSPVHLPS